MRLLMITQKIDKDDDILGAYHEWAREIAKSFDKLTVICLYKGRNELPEDIKVLSLGKEQDNFQFFRQRRTRLWRAIFKKLKYLQRFYKYIWQERENYDAVFVHMNPVYVLLGWPVWKIMGKKVYLWYAHPGRNCQVRIAYILCDKVITSVPEAFYAHGKKVVSIGQGIDTKRFLRDFNIRREENSILSLGRISPSKRVDILLEAVRMLKRDGIQPSLYIVGDPSETYGDKKYYQQLREFIQNNKLFDMVRFYNSVPNNKAPEAYNKSDIFVNLSPAGYFDKTVLEAMACECLPLVSNTAYKNVFPQHLHNLLIFRQDDAEDLAQKISQIILLPYAMKVEIGKQLRETVTNSHPLSTLGARLYNVFFI